MALRPRGSSFWKRAPESRRAQRAEAGVLLCAGLGLFVASCIARAPTSSAREHPSAPGVSPELVQLPGFRLPADVPDPLSTEPVPRSALDSLQRPRSIAVALSTPRDQIILHGAGLTFQDVSVHSNWEQYPAKVSSAGEERIIVQLPAPISGAATIRFAYSGTIGITDLRSEVPGGVLR